MIDSNDIGRKERTLWHGEVSFGNGTTLDSFQSDGNLPVLMERLTMEHMDGETPSEKVRSIKAVILSGPAAVPHFTFLSMTSVSGIVQSQENKFSSREDSPGIGEDFTVYVDGINVELKSPQRMSFVASKWLNNCVISS